MTTPPPPPDPWSPPPPGGGPPPPASPGGPPERPPGRSRKARFWIGAALAIPGLALVVALYLGLVTTADPGVAQVVVPVLTLLLLTALVAGLVVERTRWYAIGAWAAFGLLLIVGAGACVAILVGFSAAYS